MLDTLRKELLNLTLRNSLLKLREFKARGLTIVDTDSTELWQKLIEESKKCFFLPEGSSDSTARGAFNLRTNYTDKELEKRLIRTYSEAKSFIEERGINALYLSLGALKWYEDDNSDIAILAPLLLVPVQIERDVVKGETGFKLKYDGEEIEPNYTLERKMEVDFGIKLPEFTDEDTVTDYFSSLNETVKNKKRWEIVPNEIRINLFSFLKLMMYHDLDDLRWSENNKPSGNFLIANLLDDFGNLLENSDSDASNGKFELDNLPILDIDHILDADSTQAEAIESVFKNKYLVIKGPPGTGKSQTIANIIASCIKKDKTVLFVSEKLAALEVVRNRLEKTGLGAACLELHSYKANRREILASIKQSLDQKTQRNVRDNGELQRLEETRKQLNQYFSALLEPIQESEITPFQAIGEILKTKQSFPEVTFLAATNSKWSRSDILKRKESIKSTCDFVKQNGQPANSPFFGIGRLQIGLIEAEELRIKTAELQKELSQVIDMSKSLADRLKVEHPQNLRSVKQLLNTAQILIANPGIVGINTELNEKLISQNDIKTLFKLGDEFHRLKTTYDDRLLEDAHKQNFHKAKLVYETTAKKWFRFVFADFRESRKQLLNVLKIIPSTISEQLELVTVLVEKDDLVTKAGRLKNVAKEIFIEGDRWEFENDPKWLKRNLGAEYVLDIRIKCNQGEVNPQILGKLDLPKTLFISETNQLASELKAFETKFENWLSCLEVENQYRTQFWGVDTAVIDIERRLIQVANKFELLSVYCQWNAYREQLRQLGCNQVVAELLKSEISEIDQIYASWWYSMMTALLDEALKTRPFLNQTQLTNQAATFKETDRYLIERYNREKIKYEHLGRMPNLNTAGAPMGVLRNELSKKRRHLPLRKLLAQAGEMIVRIKPVFMMSPLSVAHFLSPEKIKFDYVIFDEASQVKPIEAFGALLRGDNAVVVGDDKQLPPSDFFNQVVDLDDIDEDTGVVSDMESILDLFVTKNAKQSMLQWHYRSKHESLIAVSNQYFYDARLINLPSAFSENNNLGLQFRHLPDSIYATQKNEREALYIINSLRQHAKAYPDPNNCSIGIVAFSVRQKDCIENLLMKSRKEDADLDRYLSAAEKANEPFFVKNLENVQGDERDVIFVSICYGRTIEGKLSKNFGPVNRTGGERRLNVLFTRARQKCVLFSNFTAEDLKLSDTDVTGLKVFKAFLDYAQNRRLSLDISTNRPTDSPFEDAVKAALERAGYEVHTQIGSVGYFIDLAIPHPTQNGRYLLGIECDGATYHSSRAARERDRIRQTVLEGLGWNIFRIWSTDWFRQPLPELNKLLDHIAILKSGVETQSKNTKQLSKPILEVSSADTNKWWIKYQQAKVSLSGVNQELHLTNSQRLIGIVSQYLKIESPIHEDYLKLVITQKLGIGRIGNRISVKFNEVFKLGAKQGEWIRRDKFLWSGNHRIEKARDRGELSEKFRPIEWVAPEEIQFALKKIVAEGRSISKFELMKETLRVLNGGIRLTEGIRNVIEKEVDGFINHKVFHSIDDMITLNEVYE